MSERNSTQRIPLSELPSKEGSQIVRGVEYMDSLQGELQGKGFLAGWDIKSKGDRPSEDTALIYENSHGQVVIGVFDGVGSGGYGRLASEFAQDKLLSSAQRNQDLERAPGTFLNDYIHDTGDEFSVHVKEQGVDDFNPSTTALVGVLYEREGKKRLAGVGIGDSLGFVVKADGRVLQLNQEETALQDLIAQGYPPEKAEQMRILGSHPGTVITNALGVDANTKVNQKFDIEVAEGDVILFTSDGITGDNKDQRLSGGTTNEQVIHSVMTDKTLSPKQRAQKLVTLATKRDDRTALVIEVTAGTQYQEFNKGTYRAAEMVRQTNVLSHVVDVDPVSSSRMFNRGDIVYAIRSSKDPKDPSATTVDSGWEVIGQTTDAKGDIINLRKTDEHGRVMQKNVRREKLAELQDSIEQAASLSASRASVRILDEARQAFSAVENPLLDDMSRLDSMLEQLTPQERARFDQWRIEQAAVRRKNPFDIIRESGVLTEYGNYDIKGTAAAEFVQSLSAFGVSAEKPTPEQIAQGVQQARKLVTSDQALQKLQNEPFLDEKVFQRLIRDGKRTLIRFEGSAFIDPALVRGVDGHDSWAGRGVAGRAGVGIREADVAQKLNRTERSSFDQITDYATRDTKLPAYGYLELTLILTDNGPVYYAGNAHRTSAAKLRGEPLEFSSMKIVDVRGIKK